MLKNKFKSIKDKLKSTAKRTKSKFSNTFNFRKNLSKKETEQKENPKLSKKIKPPLNRKIIIGIIITIAVIIPSISLVALYIINPELELSQVKLDPKEYELSDINASSVYPILSFNTPSRVNFSNGMEFEDVKELQIEENHLSEGMNTIEIQKESDYKFITLLSKDKQTLEINVDRITPEFEITDHTKGDYLLLEPFNFTVQSESGVKIFNGEQAVAELESNEQSLSIPTVDGENKLNLYAVDSFGNKSNFHEFSFKAFQKDGFTLKSCHGISIPMSNQLRIGYKGFQPGAYAPTPQHLPGVLANFNSESDLCNDTNMSFKFLLESDPYLRCYQCSVDGPDYIQIKNVDKALAQEINEVKKDVTVISEQDVASAQGKSMKYIKTRYYYEPLGDTIYYRYFIFEHRGKTYEISFINSNAEYTNISPFMTEIANNLKLAE
jgi:hypothetical protein